MLYVNNSNKNRAYKSTQNRFELIICLWKKAAYSINLVAMEKEFLTYTFNELTVMGIICVPPMAMEKWCVNYKNVTRKWNISHGP